MNPESTPRFQLSVWRPARLGRRVEYPRSGDDDAASKITFDSSRLHEEIYYWHPGQEDVWAIADATIAAELRERFVEGFAPNLPPEQRSMERFREAVAKLHAYATTVENDWSDLMQTVNPRRQETLNLRGNMTLSLLHQLEWIVRTFGSLPGASVTIR